MKKYMLLSFIWSLNSQNPLSSPSTYMGNLGITKVIYPKYYTKDNYTLAHEMRFMCFSLAILTQESKKKILVQILKITERYIQYLF